MSLRAEVPVPTLSPVALAAPWVSGVSQHQGRGAAPRGGGRPCPQPQRPADPLGIREIGLQCCGADRPPVSLCAGREPEVLGAPRSTGSPGPPPPLRTTLPGSLRAAVNGAAEPGSPRP